MGEQEKWEEEAKELAQEKHYYNSNAALFIHGYLQACKVGQKKIERLKEIISTQDDYVKLLIEELDELAVFASVHGWKSTRYEQGKKLREKIIQLKEEAK